MKKTVLLISSLLALSLLACSSSGTSSSSNPSSSEPAASQIDPSSDYEPSTSYDGPSEFVPGDDKYQVTFLGDTVYFNDLLENFDKATLSDDYYGGEFNNKLPTPMPEVYNLNELSEVLDYCAFYQEESFDIILKYTYEGSIREEFNKAWWNSLLLPGVVGFELSNVSDDGTATINFKYNKLANAYHPKNVYETDVIPYVYHNPVKTPVNEVPYTPTKGPLDVYNSDQLLYAVLHGYEPIIAEDAKLQMVYDKAVSIITSTLYEEMSVQEKCSALTWRLVSMTCYDDSSDEAAAYIDLSKAETFPDEGASTFSGGYIEGPLLYGAGFCHGMAKTSALLLGLAGLDVTKVSSSIYSLESTINAHDQLQGYWSHGYNYVLDPSTNKYIVNDPTFMYAGTGRNTYPGRLLRMNGPYVPAKSWEEIYHQMVPDIFKLDHENEMLEVSDFSEWYDIFYLNESKTSKPVVTNHDYSKVFVNSDDNNSGYYKNIQEYISHYGINETRRYHVELVPLDANDDPGSPAFFENYYFELGDVATPYFGEYTYYSIYNDAYYLQYYGLNYYPDI